MLRYIYKFHYHIILFSLLLITNSCEDSLSDNKNKLPPDNQNKVTISQGVWGNVWFWDGNFMPSTDNSSSGKITAVVRTIYVYKAARVDSVIRDLKRSSFIKKINSDFVEKITSDKDGFFQISLTPGKYSFFVKEDSLYFAGESDGDGHLMSAQVILNKVVKKQIDINYKAVY